MKLKAVINGSEYDIVQGATFSEEFNETLDSGSIIIDGVSQIDELKPYDDVFIYDAEVDEFQGYANPVLATKGYSYSAKRNADYYIGEDEGYPTFLLFSSLVGKIKAYDRTMAVLRMTDTNEQYSIGTYLFTFGDSGNVYATLTSAIRGTPQNQFVFEKSDSGYLCKATQLTTLSVFSFRSVLNATGLDLKYKGFYRHLLVDQYTEQCTNISQGIYKYKIELFSETKKLEAIQLPNMAITQPVKMKEKKSVWDYLVFYCEKYSPKVKITTDGVTWEYVQKYLIQPELEEVFKNTYAPDFSLTTPSLKDVMNQLMMTRDRIPYVKDDVICGLDISARGEAFNFDESCVTQVIGSMSSENYADNLRRQYHNALSDRYSAHIIEYCGFRNSENALLTLSNMRVETRYPIYRINKMYLCYYKQGNVYKEGQTSAVGTRTFLCKQDITSLVMLDSARNILSQDWETFENLKAGTDGAIAIEDMAKFQMSTLSYSIGSNAITGWGTEYSHNKDFAGWFKTTYTPVQNIGVQLDKAHPYGIYGSGFVSNTITEEGETFSAETTDDLGTMISAFEDDDNTSLKMKGFFFELDYEAFYDGATITSKDGGRDDVTMIDNSSTSLVLLEKDGIFQKEKIDRFGNKAIQISSAYASVDDMQDLGSVYERGKDSDVVIYHREYSIYDNVVQCVYYGTKDYVLKNYYTSVYSQNRPFSLLAYDQSVNRAETSRLMLYMSKDELYYEGVRDISFSNYGSQYVDKILSAFVPSPIASSKGVFEFTDNVNSAFMVFGDVYYMSDINSFVSGYSLCFNAKMFDNVTMGVYVDEREPDYWTDDNYAGATQQWYKVTDDNGFVESAEVVFAHCDFKEYYYNKAGNVSKSDIKDVYYSRIFAQPKMNNASSYISKSIEVSVPELYKDNKETIDFTLQIEPLGDDDIAFSPWLMRLSDLLATYNKVNETYEALDEGASPYTFTFYNGTLSYSYYVSGTTVRGCYPAIMLSMPNDVFSSLKASTTELKLRSAETMIWNSNTDGGNGGGQSLLTSDRVGYYSFTPQKIVSISDTAIEIEGVETFVYMDAFWLFGTSTTSQTTTIKLIRATASNPVGHVDFDYTNNAVFSDTFPALKDATIANPVPLVDSITRSPNIRSRTFPTEYNISVLPRLIGGTTGSQQAIGFNPSVTAVVKLDDVSKTTYSKNMFVSVSPGKMKKEVIYEELASADDANIVSDLKVTDVFSFQTDEYRRPYVYVNLSSISVDFVPHSVGYWYWNEESESYVFVFGVNISDSDYAKGYAKIYLSLLQTKDKRVYNSGMKQVGEIRNCASDDYTGNYGTGKELDE